VAQSTDVTRLDEIRAEALQILELSKEDVTSLFYRESMRRGLSKLVRQLDRLVRNGSSDRELGLRALKHLGFSAED
jgi:hypothetical protein